MKLVPDRTATTIILVLVATFSEPKILASFGEFQALKIAKIFTCDISKELKLQKFMFGQNQTFNNVQLLQDDPNQSF